MIKNRITQLIFQTAYCALAIVGFIGSLGIFQAKFTGHFYVYFTNLSNYFCMGIMFAELVSNIKKANKREDGVCDVCPKLKFMGVVYLTITCLVYNFVLAPVNQLALSLTVHSILLHIVLPVMFVLDWFLFYQRKNINWKYPLITLILPLIYLVFVMVRAWIMGWQGEFVYPYFFLDVTKLGIGGLFMWIGILLAAFLAFGFLFYYLDWLIAKKQPKEITMGQKFEGKFGFRETCFGICVRNGKMLLVKKNEQYSLPGGGIEKNEKQKDCLKREFLEEVGYTIAKSKKLATIDCYWTTRDDYKMRSLTHIYVVKVNDNNIAPTEDGNLVEEVDIDNVEQLLPLPYHKKALEVYFDKLKK
ncbi:MAG: Pr6Pr family membrane protein [Clostridia bacterium]|nr:Pr6Pr family membrane protein [Clostridia bacterium]